jgi:hypothetical protein
VPPGKVKALDKVILDGQFGVDDARWNNPEMREKLKSLSARAQGKPKDEDAGSAISDLKGSIHLEKGIIHFQHLAFGVQGALMVVAGTYSMEDGTIDMKGHLRLEAKLSDTVTGKKSFFLKVFDPFFSKDGAGTELPITITGTREKPVFGVTVLHRQIKKPVESKLSSGGEDRRGEPLSLQVEALPGCRSEIRSSRFRQLDSSAIRGRVPDVSVVLQTIELRKYGIFLRLLHC